MRHLALALLLTGCAPYWESLSKEKPLDECHQRARDIEFVCSTRPNICGNSKILCPGDSIKL